MNSSTILDIKKVIIIKQLYIYLSSTSNSGRNHACASGATTHFERTINEGTRRMTWDFMWRVYAFESNYEYNILDQQIFINMYKLQETYGGFQGFGISHIKKGKLDVKHMKCFSISYLEGVKGYRLWKTELIGPRGEN
ncbi:hypothetical protein MTR_5g069130 [Medicago truncatula]|uniref:Uncharacterized protein n=1 Tax=Medicago truncatula TaxID=3880 RepID=G7KDZ3_MEDTR|nr:hypothetical protein MTR_5g069130 [Medicago truncatula]